MKRIRAVSFDLDGTLVTHAYIDLFWNYEIPKIYAEKRGLPFEEAKRLVWREYDEVGESDLRWYLPGYWFERFGFEESVGDVIKKLRDRVEVYPDADRLLRKLDCKLALVSSAAREFIEVALEVLGGNFDVIVSTVSDFNAITKDGEIFRKACEMLGEDPGYVLHVGDHEVFDYQVPKRVGMPAYVIDRSGEKRGPHVLKSLDELERLIKG